MRNTFLALSAAPIFAAGSGCGCMHQWWGPHSHCENGGECGSCEGCSYCGPHCGACGCGGGACARAIAVRAAALAEIVPGGTAEDMLRADVAQVNALMAPAAREAAWQEMGIARWEHVPLVAAAEFRRRWPIS